MDLHGIEWNVKNIQNYPRKQKWNSGLRSTYGNDPEIFSISIMGKVPENQNSRTISGTIFFP